MRIIVGRQVVRERRPEGTASAGTAVMSGDDEWRRRVAPATLLVVTLPLKAHVQNGRLVLDAPTDLPEGEVVYLRPAEAGVGDEDDDFDDDERVAIQKALDEGLAAISRGNVVDADEVIGELLARR